MRAIDADALRKLLEEHAETGEDEFDKGYDLGIQTAIEMIDNAPTVEDERIGRVLETIQTVIDDTNGDTDNVSKAMRNTAKFIRNAIDREMPDYETIEGEDCGERPTGEWIRKKDIIHSIAEQYSAHHELVPTWLCIGDVKGGAEE